MRSELVNYLQIKTYSKLLLRALIEENMWNEDIDENSEISLHRAFVSSKLTFGEAIFAIKELEFLQLIRFPLAPHVVNVMYLTLYKFIKTTMEDIEVNQRGTIAIVDYKEICSLIEQKELAGDMPVGS